VVPLTATVNANSGSIPYYLIHFISQLTYLIFQKGNSTMTTPAFFIEGEHRPTRWLVTCDHASNRVPDEIGNASLGLPYDDMARHIAFDIGAAGVAKALGTLLDAPVILSNFSRLVIDPNRGEDDPTLIMQLYDGTLIPENRSVNADERMRRIETYYRPYHNAYAGLANRQPDTVILSIHSFTPQLRNRSPRPWDVGVLFAHDQRLSDPVIRHLRAESDLTIGVNEPYTGHLPKDAVDRHGLQHNRLNALIELRNDLIETADQQMHWAMRLAPIFTNALSETDC
jgi:predicted N-formylglutamate amidohydrolase